MKIKKLLLTFIAAMSLGVSHATVGNEVVDMSNQQSQWISLVSTNNLYFNSSYTNGKDHELVGGECFAFKAVAGDLEKGIVYLKHISVVRAGTPIWIWGSKEAHSIMTFTDLDDISTHDNPISFDNVSNLLVGSASETTTTKAGDYVLSKKDDYVHAVTSAMAGNALPAGKCLLRLVSASRATLSIGLLDDETEGIDAVMTRDGELIMYDPSKPSFDAQGRRMDPQQKGLHIQNGYKFIIK
jgi:hypothetical protein